MSTDESGNLILSGSYYGDTLSFDSIKLSNAGERDIFIVKFDPSGNALWAKSAGGTSHDRAYGVATDSLGNVIITGSFYGPDIAFDSLHLNGNGDIFIAKYDPSGNVLWAKSFHGNSIDEATGISTDSSGNIFITGTTWSEFIQFDDIQFIDTGFYHNIFIVECNSLGDVIWAKIVKGDNCGIGAFSICSDTSGDPLIAGFYHSQSLSFGDYTLVNNGISDVFLAKIHIKPRPAGISKLEFSNNIYPNPGNGQFNLISSKVIDKIEIANILGQIIYVLNTKDKRIIFQIDSPGLYLITITSGNQRVTKKLIVN